MIDAVDSPLFVLYCRRRKRVDGSSSKVLVGSASVTKSSMLKQKTKKRKTTTKSLSSNPASSGIMALVAASAEGPTDRVGNAVERVPFAVAKPPSARLTIDTTSSFSSVSAFDNTGLTPAALDLLGGFTPFLAESDEPLELSSVDPWSGANSVSTETPKDVLDFTFWGSEDVLVNTEKEDFTQQPDFQLETTE